MSRIVEDAFIVDAVTPNRYVFNGSTLLREKRWLRGAQLKNLTHSYVRYVCSYKRAATIVFDGYNNRNSMESNEHARIAITNCQVVVINKRMYFILPKKSFFATETATQVLLH